MVAAPVAVAVPLLEPLAPSPVAVMARPQASAAPVPGLEPVVVAAPAVMATAAPVVASPVAATTTVGTSTTVIERPTELPDEPVLHHPVDHMSVPASAATFAPGGWDAAPARAGTSPALGGSRFSGTSAPVPGGLGRSGMASAPTAVAKAPTGMSKGAKRAIVGVIILALLAALAIVVVLPRVRDKQAADAAAAAPAVLPHAAPRALGGDKTAAMPGVNPAASASSVKNAGAAWAWAATYGHGAEHTVYLAADVPADTRAIAMRAQTDASYVPQLLSAVKSTMAIDAAAEPAMSSAVEYGSKVGGKAWCMPATFGGNGGGYCLWTNGKDLLQVLSYPSVAEMSARHTLAALTQLAAAPRTK